MFSGLRVQGPQTSVDATSISDLKNLKALHNNEDIAVTIRLADFIEMIESLGAGEGEDEPNVEELLNIITDLERELDNLEDELADVQAELDEAHAMINDNE